MEKELIEKVESARYYLTHSANNCLDNGDYHYQTIEDFYHHSIGVACGWIEMVYDYKVSNITKYNEKVKKVHEILDKWYDKMIVPSWFKKEFKEYISGQVEVGQEIYIK